MSRWSAAVAALTLLGACGGSPKRPGAPDVVVEGNHAIGDGALAAGLALPRTTNEPVDAAIAAADAARIRHVYLRRGYFAVRVEPVVESPARARFVVVEGARATVSRVDILGAPDPAAIAAAVPLAAGDAYDHDAYERGKLAAVRALQRAGYPHAQVIGRVHADAQHATAVIELEVVTGPRARFGEVELIGVEPALADAVRARLAIEPGAWFTPDALDATRLALTELRRFDLVTVDAQRTPGATVIPVIVRVTPGKRHVLRAGAGVGVDPVSYEVHGRLGYAVTGWPGALWTARAELRPAVVSLRDDRDVDTQVEAVGALERLDLFHPRVVGAVEASVAYRPVEAYTMVGPAVSAGVRSPLSDDRTRVEASWRLRVTDFQQISGAIDEPTQAALGIDARERVGAFEQALVVDHRDSAIEPTRGARGELRITEGGAFAGGAEAFVKGTFDASAHVPLGTLGLATRVKVASLLGDQPATERMFGGGGSSHRGFPSRQLGPRVEDVVVGGGALVESSVELRVPTRLASYQLVGIAFVDAGDVTDDWDALDATNLHWATGSGLRLRTELGLIGMDVAYRLNRTGADEPRPDDHWVWHFALGSAF